MGKKYSLLLLCVLMTAGVLAQTTVDFTQTVTGTYDGVVVTSQGLSLQTSSVPSQNNLVGYWSFDTGFTDELGSGITGSCSGSACPTATTGTIGGAYRFDGVDDTLDFGAHSQLDFTDTSFSVSVWVKPGTDVNVWDKIMHKGTRTWALELKTENGGYGFTTFDTWFDVTQGGTFTPNAWVHLVGVYDVVAKTNKLYVNGALANQKTGAEFVDDAGLHALVLAYYPNGDPGQKYAQYTIDELRMWDKALSASEISTLYAATSPSQGTFESNTVSTNTFYETLTATISASGPSPQLEISTDGGSTWCTATSGVAISAPCVLPATDFLYRITLTSDQTRVTSITFDWTTASVTSQCGNQQCEAAKGETCSTCSQDCGLCPQEPTLMLDIPDGGTVLQGTTVVLPFDYDNWEIEEISGKHIRVYIDTDPVYYSLTETGTTYTGTSSVGVIQEGTYLTITGLTEGTHVVRAALVEGTQERTNTGSSALVIFSVDLPQTQSQTQAQTTQQTQTQPTQQQTGYWTHTHAYDDKPLTEQGTIEQVFTHKERITFLFGGETHYIGVVGISTIRATVELGSQSQRVVMGLAETREVDVTGDGVADVALTLKEIRGVEATFTLSALHDGTVEQPSPLTPEKKSEGSNERLAFILFMITTFLAVLLGVLYYIHTRTSDEYFV